MVDTLDLIDGPTFANFFNGVLNFTPFSDVPRPAQAAPLGRETNHGAVLRVGRRGR